MIRVGRSHISERLERFDTYDEAYVFARMHGIDINEIEDDGATFNIAVEDRKVKDTERYIAALDKSSTSDNWKSRISTKLGGYTGEGYVIMIYGSSNNPRYFAGRFNLKYSNQLTDAKVFRYEKDAKTASKYGDSDHKRVLKVKIVEGRIVKVLSH